MTAGFVQAASNSIFSEK
ncbi:hypothetical protein MKC97_19205 [[Clostridium] innocuum]|nr:hypothetical protein [[Clostridium] innocuum]MCR0266458.1 hypothetical protein [[Clostridium] innocuum]